VASSDQIPMSNLDFSNFLEDLSREFSLTRNVVALTTAVKKKLLAGMHGFDLMMVVCVVCCFQLNLFKIRLCFCG